MTDPLEKLVREFNRLDKETNDLYHEVALGMGLSDSAFCILYILNDRGDGCLQRDICAEAFVSKQTVNSSIRRLEGEGYLCLRRGKGRDKHIFLTEKGRQFVAGRVVPVMEAEKAAFSALGPEERRELLRLSALYVEHLKRALRGHLQDEIFPGGTRA